MKSRTPPASRRLRISASHYECRRDRRPWPPAVPFLRLRGYWLRQAGFDIGADVRVEISEQRIVIVPAS
ncbi:SymE family type I addiction module toxin [Lysobacter panacisoli]|uniref:Toxin SymE-like domain-containing protein n=1 Tax=Lysobacter panacisoli TaxID=1255263 RepID=A0ABP9LMS4_9GAMM|nr:SymE family type I addiction module toxin [Lysobacter panacisoli]